LAKADGPSTVLVVEDDDSMRDAIETLLSLSGYKTVSYGSAEALLADDAVEPLCVISDLNLPAMSGLDLLMELRRRGWPTPVIIITAFDSSATRAEAIRRGAVAYMAKPFPSVVLLTAISNIATTATPL
jgi:FixJ family two-component response regulator